jgi:hypothetical protein
VNIKLEVWATKYASQHAESRESKTSMFGNSSTPRLARSAIVISSDRTLLEARLTASYLTNGGALRNILNQSARLRAWLINSAALYGSDCFYLFVSSHFQRTGWLPPGRLPYWKSGIYPIALHVAGS